MHNFSLNLVPLLANEGQQDDMSEPRINQPDPDTIDWSTPIDRSRFFLCPSLTPLYHSKIYGELNQAQQNRYNQLIGIYHNELISQMERLFVESLKLLFGRSVVPDTIRSAISTFVEDEQHHIAQWDRLNRLSEPSWYGRQNLHLLQAPTAGLWLLNRLSHHPRLFLLIFWMMMILEECSLEISHRCGCMPANRIEPRYAAIYRRHS